MFEVQKVAARYGRHTGVHTRFTPDDATHENLGAQEIIANGLALGAPVSILHFNNPGWRLTHELIARLSDQGFNVSGEIYPYAAGSTTANAVFMSEENWVDRLGHKYEDTVQDPITGDFYTKATFCEAREKDPTRLRCCALMDSPTVIASLSTRHRSRSCRRQLMPAGGGLGTNLSASIGSNMNT